MVSGVSVLLLCVTMVSVVVVVGVIDEIVIGVVGAVVVNLFKVVGGNGVGDGVGDIQGSEYFSPHFCGRGTGVVVAEDWLCIIGTGVVGMGRVTDATVVGEAAVGCCAGAAVA